jgi:predicted PurR-regulated permease PerM
MKRAAKRMRAARREPTMAPRAFQGCGGEAMMNPDRQEATETPASVAGRFRHVLTLAIAVLVLAVGLFLIWQSSSSLFLIFAGLLFAVFLDACTRALGKVWRVSRPWRLGVVCLVLLSSVIAATSLGGYTAARQADDLFTTVEQQLRVLRGQFRSAPASDPSSRAAPEAGTAPQLFAQESPQRGGPARSAPQESGDVAGVGPVLRTFFPNASALLQSATTVLGGLAGVVGNVVVVFFLGLYVAIDPATYRQGTLRLFPPGRRAEMGAALDEAAETLRWWVLGQLASITIIAGLTYVALLVAGMPGALVLALLTGALAFIPYIGSFVAGAIIILAGLAQGPVMAMWGAGVYILVQLVESYALSPVIQRWSVNLPPALVIGGLTLLGAIFGMWGFVLAAPLLAVMRVLVLRFWVARVEKAS